MRSFSTAATLALSADDRATLDRASEPEKS
jgi:hypothetical protein